MTNAEICTVLQPRIDEAINAVAEQTSKEFEDWFGQFYAPIRLMYEGKIRSWQEWEQIKAKIGAMEEREHD